LVLLSERELVRVLLSVRVRWLLSVRE